MSEKRQLDVHLYVTPRCNLACPHCYYDALDRSQHPNNLMPLARISSILTGICDRFDADISVEGGETFLRKGIGEMLSELDAHVLGSITVTTNGTVPIRMPESALRSLRGLRVSIDGHTDELNKQLRGIEVDPALETCRSLRERSVPFTVRMTLWKQNIGLLAEIFDWVGDNGIEQLSLFEYQSSGRGIGQDLLYGVSGPAIDAFLTELASLDRPSCLRYLTVNLAERRLAATLKKQEDLASSGIRTQELPGVANCTINYDGTVGVSPWRVTAHGASDIFTSVGADDFLGVIEAAASEGALADNSGSISRVQLRLGQPA